MPITAITAAVPMIIASDVKKDLKEEEFKSWANFIKNNQIDFKTGIIFAIPAFLGVYIARAYLLDLIPNQILFLYQCQPLLIQMAL